LKVGDQIEAKPGRWSFQGDVSKHFSEHVSRSVPFYKEGHDLIIKLSDFFVMDGSICYDLGSSNGDLLLALADHNADKKARFIGLDMMKPMCDTANKRKENRKNITFVNEDILSYEYEPSDFVVSYYTLQFVRPKVRQVMFDTIFKTLNWGGGFVLFEKVRAPDARFQDIASALYFEYKKNRGYNNDEILDKYLSLKGILEPFSSQANIDMLKRAGFVDIMPIMKFICFEGFLAIK
jgi:tRNA (cmo5U34)-methyltransferase